LSDRLFFFFFPFPLCCVPYCMRRAKVRPRITS
jgi:hypothetical protein